MENELFYKILMESKEIINKSSLGRIWQHLENNKSFGIITAFRGEYSVKENRLRNKELKKLLRENGYGYFVVEGYFVENHGTDEENPVKEESLFVIGKENDKNLLGFLTKIGQKFNQDSILFKNGEETDIKLVSTKKGIESFSLGKWTPNKVGEFYSKVKGKPYVFESVQPNSNMERLRLKLEKKS